MSNTGKCKTKKCGCLDTGLTTPTPCEHDTFLCPVPEQCPETFSDCCVVHTGDTIVDIDIQQGDRLCDILQKLALLITNPNCVTPGAACIPPVGLHSINVTTSTIKLGWNPSSTAVNGYVVEYREISATSWMINPQVPQSASPVDTIGGLLPNTYYYIRVRPVCSIPSSCYSVTILVKTKQI
jgi:hypothetical protein